MKDLFYPFIHSLGHKKLLIYYVPVSKIVSPKGGVEGKTKINQIRPVDLGRNLWRPNPCRKI